MTKAVMLEEKINMEGLKSGTYAAIISTDGKVVFRCKIIQGSTFYLVLPCI